MEYDLPSHDVFLCHSKRDKNVADAIVASLEADGIRCWCAPRDVRTGEDWPTAISSAIRETSVMVLVYTENSNQSQHVAREVHLAASKGKTILPFRLSQEELSEQMEYYLAGVQWLDAMTPPLEQRIAALCRTVRAVLAEGGDCGRDVQRDASADRSRPVGYIPVRPQAQGKPSAGDMTGKRAVWMGMATALVLLALVAYRVSGISSKLAANASDAQAAQSESVGENDGGVSDDDYILPESNSRYYSRDELEKLSDWELWMARNEIYARHGRIFSNEEAQSYFESKSWYEGLFDGATYDKNGKPRVANEFEAANCDLIERIERERGSEYAK